MKKILIMAISAMVAISAQAYQVGSYTDVHSVSDSKAMHFATDKKDVYDTSNSKAMHFGDGKDVHDVSDSKAMHFATYS